MANAFTFRNMGGRSRLMVNVYRTPCFDNSPYDRRVCDWMYDWNRDSSGSAPSAQGKRSDISTYDFVSKYSDYRLGSFTCYLVWIWTIAENHCHYLDLLLSGSGLGIGWIQADKRRVHPLHENVGSHKRSNLSKS